MKGSSGSAKSSHGHRDKPRFVLSFCVRFQKNLLVIDYCTVVAVANRRARRRQNLTCVHVLAICCPVWVLQCWLLSSDPRRRDTVAAVAVAAAVARLRRSLHRHPACRLGRRSVRWPISNCAIFSCSFIVSDSRLEGR